MRGTINIQLYCSLSYLLIFARVLLGVTRPQSSASRVNMRVPGLLLTALLSSGILGAYIPKRASAEINNVLSQALFEILQATNAYPYRSTKTTP